MSFPGVPTAMTLNAKNRGFSELLAILGCNTHFFEEWIVPKAFKIHQDNLHMKCSALNIDFHSVRFDRLGSSSRLYERIKFGYPRWKCAISGTVD